MSIADYCATIGAICPSSYSAALFRMDWCSVDPGTLTYGPTTCAGMDFSAVRLQGPQGTSQIWYFDSTGTLAAWTTTSGGGSETCLAGSTSFVPACDPPDGAAWTAIQLDCSGDAAPGATEGGAEAGACLPYSHSCDLSNDCCFPYHCSTDTFQCALSVPTSDGG